MSSGLMWDFGFSGSATILETELHVDVFLKERSVALLSLERISGLTLSELFDQFFSPAGLSWPSEIVDLSLTNATIFYSYVSGTDFPSLSGLPQPVLDQQANVSGKGLYITTDISLELAGKNFAGSAFITVVANRGFSVTGTLSDPINFLDADFLYLTAPGSSAGGPTLSLQSFGTSQFTLTCGCKLFGEQLADSVLTLSTGSPELTAQLTSNSTIAPFSKPLELDFTWNRSTGLVIDKFPSLSLPQVPIEFKKLATLLSDASKANGCGELKNLVLKDGLGIQTNFKVTPSLTGTVGNVAVLIEGYYQFGVAGRVIGLICFPPLSFTLPSNLTFNGISDSLIRNIVSNAQAIIEALWKDKDALAFILMIIMTKKAFENMISQLVCDDLKEELEQLDENWDPPPDPPAPSPSSGPGGAGGGGASLNLGGLIGAAATAISIGHKLGSTLGSTLGHVGSAFGSLFGSDDDSGPPPPPTIIQLTYAVDAHALVLVWTIVHWLAGYDVQLTDSSGKVVTTTRLEMAFFLDPTRPGADGDNDFASMPLEHLTIAPGVCTIGVRWTYFSDNSPWTQTTIEKLAPPANVSMSLDATGETVTVNWDSVASATEYVIAVRDPNTNGEPAPITFIPPSGAGKKLEKRLWPGQIGTDGAGNYVASVKSSAGGTAIPSDQVVTPPFPKFATPTSVNQSVVPGALRVTWTHVANETSYRVLVFNLNASGEALNVTVSVEKTEASAAFIERDFSFDHFQVKSPGPYVASVIALGDARHIASNAMTSVSVDVLFSGIGSMQIGSTFIVS